MSAQTVESRDGTPIAHERLGNGPTLVLVAGALQGRDMYRPLAEALATAFTVLLYDRRGRGASGGGMPFGVDDEVADLSAVAALAAEPPVLYGHSSGAALVLHAADRGQRARAIVLHDPPFGDAADDAAEREEASALEALLREDRPAEAVRTFLASSGVPPEVARELARDPALVRNAATIPVDPYELTSASSRGGRTPAGQASGLDVPVVALAGERSPPFMLEAARAIAAAAPSGRFELLAGQDHAADPAVVAAALADLATDARGT